MSERLRTLTGAFSWRLPELTWPVETEVGPGLGGVIACGTRVSWLDPSSGLLLYRGQPVERLAGTLAFEEVAHLLITGRMASDDEAEHAAFVARLRAARELPAGVSALVAELCDGEARPHPTLVLRAAVSALGCHELAASDDLAGGRHWRELRIVGQVAAVVGLIARRRRGLSDLACEPGCGLASGMLRALGEGEREPDPEDLAVLDLLWVLYADHGVDAPTFTSLIVASCLADPYYNVVAGLSALRGPRLGGASEQVLAQLLPLLGEGEDRARAWVREEVARGGRIAGFGHRLYRMPDPRAVVLRREAALTARRKGREALFSVARAVEDEASRLLAPRGAHVNINFYAALLFHLLGAEAELLPCLYMVGRMAGLVARVTEAIEGGRLFRPLTRYVGPREGGTP